MQIAFIQAGMGGDGEFAAAVEREGDFAFRGDPRRRFLVVQASQQIARRLIAGAAFHADGALTRRRQAIGDVESCANALLKFEAHQARAGKDDRVVLAFVEFAEAGADVAAQVREPQIGPQAFELALAAQARSADDGFLRQVGKAAVIVRHERIARVATLAGHGQLEAFGKLRRDVFHRMHGDIGLAIEHCALEFLDEKPLAAEPRQRAMQHAVAGGGEAEYFDFEPGMGPLQGGFDMVRLPHRQRAVAACDSKDGSGHVAESAERRRVAIRACR